MGRFSAWRDFFKAAEIPAHSAGIGKGGKYMGYACVCARMCELWGVCGGYPFLSPRGVVSWRFLEFSPFSGNADLDF